MPVFHFMYLFTRSDIGSSDQMAHASLEIRGARCRPDCGLFETTFTCEAGNKPHSPIRLIFPRFNRAEPPPGAGLVVDNARTDSGVPNSPFHSRTRTLHPFPLSTWSPCYSIPSTRVDQTRHIDVDCPVCGRPLERAIAAATDELSY